jgi:hypothetical protein
MKIGAVLLVGLTACAVPRSPTPPTARVGSAEEAVKAAVREGARTHPRALRQLQLAESELARARALIRQGEYREAESLLKRAEADAEVAEALARQAHVRAQANVARPHVASSGQSPSQ